jgi:hypothetical protein
LKCKQGEIYKFFRIGKNFHDNTAEKHPKKQLAHAIKHEITIETPIRM